MTSASEFKSSSHNSAPSFTTAIKPLTFKMIATLGAISAFLLGLRRWVPDHDRLVTATHWQGGPYNSWVPLSRPVTYEYQEASVVSELILFFCALAYGVWAWKNRNHKVDRIFARGVLALCAAGALYLMMLWLGRQHVEGNWAAVRPHLVRYEVDTPEQLAKDAAWKAKWDAHELKRTGLTPEQKEKHMNKIAFIGYFFFVFMTMCFVKAACEPTKEDKKRR